MKAESARLALIMNGGSLPVPLSSEASFGSKYVTMMSASAAPETIKNAG